MSLLSLCQDVIAETGYGTPPVSIIGNSDAMAVQLLALANASAKKVMREHNWQSLINVYTATTTADSDELVSFNSNGLNIIGDTAWNTDTFYPVGTVMTLSQLNNLKYSIGSNSSLCRHITLVKDIVRIQPTPTVTGETISFFVVAKYPVWSSQYSNYLPYFQLDADTTLVPEHLVGLCLKWMLIKAKGFDYSEEYNEYQRSLQLAIARDTPSGELNDSRLTGGLFSQNGINIGNITASDYVDSGYVE